MKRLTIAGTTLASAVVSCAITGAAFADSGTTATIGGTSNDTTNQVTVNSSSSTTYTNNSHVTVTNGNSQSVSSGNANVNDVSQVGDVSSGSASASNTTTTTIGGSGSGSNPSNPGMGGGSGGSGTGGLGGGSGSASASGSGSSSGSGGSGSGSGVSLSAAMLPDTGPSVPVDVSALRALWHDPTALVGTTAAQKASLVSGSLLATATLLSLAGAGATALYEKRRRLKV